ncbi:MAG: cation transporter [Bacteroidota bacterium]
MSAKQAHTFHIDGMSCDHCVRTVQTVLDQIDEVEVESVVLGQATVRFDPEKVAFVDLASLIEEEGYVVKP